MDADALMPEDWAYLQLLIGDPHNQVFSDDDLRMVVKREPSLKLAAAQLLDMLAGSELLMSKKITSQDLTTDGPAVAAELRALAAELRRQDAEAWGIAAAPMGRW